MDALKKYFGALLSDNWVLPLTYGIMLLLLAAFTVFSYVLPYDREGFDAYTFVTLSRDWVQVMPDGKEIPIPSLPADLGDAVGEEVVIRRQLPGLFLVEGRSLFIKSNHQIVTVRVNGEEIYKYQFFAHRRYDANFPPSKWLVIPISSQYSGAILEISMTRLQDDNSDTVSRIYFGDKADIIFMLARHNVFPLACGIITFLIGVFFVILQIVRTSRRELGRRNLYVGMLLCLLALWLVCNSDIRQILFDNILYARNMEFISLLMLPVPIILSVNASEGGRYSSAAQALCLVIGAIDLVILFLILWGYNFLSLLWLIHILLLVAAAYIVASFWRIAVNDLALCRSLRFVWISYAVLVLFGVMEILDMRFFASRHKGVCLSLGVLFYALGLTVEQTRTQTRLILQAQRAEMESRAKSDFLASMSHEIRTPINAVLGMDEMILREAEDPAVLSYAADIRSAGQHLLSLVNDILDISRIESGRTEIVEAEYDLEALLTDICDLIRVQADEKGLAFDARLLSVMPNHLRGDVSRIRQIAINLLNNAVKYTRRGRVIFSVDAPSVEEVSFLREEALIKGEPPAIDDPFYLRMTIRDTGIGIRQEDVATIFDSFRRLDTAENAGIQGTGLGLPIVSTLVQLMHGCLLVKSVYGVGSQFTVVLPQEELSGNRIGSFAGRAKSPSELKEAEKTLFHAPEAKVLAVDDNLLNRRLLTALLRRTEVQLTTCESGEECLRLVHDEHYDLILMDHLMPGMDGIETLCRMREMPDNRSADVPVIVLTANAITGVRESYLSAGFNDYLSKPIQSAELERMMMRYLPPELVHSGAGKTADAAGENDAAALPDWLHQVEALDVALGLSYCGTTATYLDTLVIYARNAAAFADEIEGLYRAGDIANTTVKIHALKSTSLAVGAQSLSKLAEKLEAAGKAGDVKTIDEELDDLLARYRTLGQQLAPLLDTGAEKDETAAPPVSDAQLREMYDMIRGLLDEFEYDRAAAMIDSLAGLRVPEGERERCERLKRASDNFEWERINDILP